MCLLHYQHNYREQDFSNYVSLSDYRKAIHLALTMEQPGRLLNLFRDIQSVHADDNSIIGLSSVDEVIRTLGGSELATLLRYVRDWNTNAKTSGVAQRVLYAVVKLKSAEAVMKACSNDLGDVVVVNSDTVESKVAGASGMALKELVDALIPYTERHLSRMDKLIQDSYMVDYILGEMDDGIFDVEDDMMNVDVDAHTV